MELDFMSFVKILATSTLSLIIYRLFIIDEYEKEKKETHYTTAAWNFFLKKLYAQRVIDKQKKKKQKILKELKNYESESPKILPREDSSDSQQLYGADHEGNSILVKFTRRRHRVAEVWLILRLKSGSSFTTYTLPDHPNTQITNATPRIFEGAGLKLECLQPYSKWRLTYTGMLRKGISTEANNNDDENEIFFVRLNFFFAAASFPSFWPYEWSTKLMATALATEQWRDGKWKNLLTLKDAGGYGQFGAYNGQVRIYENNYEAYKAGLLPKVETIELNLPGIRQRRWGPAKTEHLHRTAVIIGTIKDGTVIEVGAFSSKYGVTHSQFGNVRAPNGDVLPINWTDLHLAAVGEYQDQLPQATIVQITAGAGDKEFIAVVTFRNHEKVPLMGGNVGEKWKSYIVPVDIVCNTIRGYGVAIFWYPNEKHFEIFEEEIPSEIKRIFHRNDLPSSDKQVLSFAEKEAQSVLVSGGKGASLAILRAIQETKGEQFFDHRSRNYQVLNALVDQFSSSGATNKLLRNKHLMNNETPQRQRSGSLTKIIFPDPNDYEDKWDDFYVPQGFLVSVSAYEEHLKNFIEVRRAIKELESIAYEKVEGDIEAVCQKVQETFLSTKLSEVVKVEIAQKLRRISELDKDARFAVRSSGVTEDAEELSSAGQNQTFLGLRSPEEIFESIIKCWSSLYSYQSVMYRKQNIQPVSTSMAVVIQKMVDAESAGVLFSRHFLNGDPSIIVITANYGLGESVVSAKSEPDTFLIKRHHKNDKVEMLATIVGEKKFIIEMDTKEATKEIELDDEKRKKACLTSDVALKLAKLSIMMEKFFGTPRDIEFAVTKDKRIYLLQSRAITALNNFTDYEIMHERDGAVMSCQDILTRANVGEVLPFATSSLSMSIIRESLDNQLKKAISNIPENLVFQRHFPVFQNQIFIDACKVLFPSLSEEIKVFDEAMFLGVFGSKIFDLYPQIKEICIHRNTFNDSASNRIRQLKILGGAWWNSNKYLKEAKEGLAELKVKFGEKNLLKYKTSSDVVNAINMEFKPLNEISNCHLSSSNVSILYQAIAFSILLHGAKEMTTEHQRDVTLLLGSIGDIESANIPEMIREISKSIISHQKDEAFLKVEPSNGVQWLQENCTKAFELFTKFIERHGHRGLREFDLATKPWGMQPEKIIEMIQANIKLGVQDAEVKKIDILNELKTPLGPRAKKFLGKIIPYYHKAVRRREETKSIYISAINELRRAVRYLAQKMVNEGLLPDKELIFHLTYREVQIIIKTRNSRLISNAVRRQKFQQKLDENKFDEIVFGFPKPIQEDKADEVIEEGDVLARGLPVCSGIITARACVIQTFAEINLLQKGDILVTYSTDIGWSPYFPLLSGVCTEIGGLISHGAVVARECNLPCIVGANKATKRIKHGQLITLNGDEGIIVNVK